MSDESGTEWADCAICEITTDPDENPPGDRSNRDVEVRGEVGNGALGMCGVSRTGVRSVLAITGDPAIVADGGKGTGWLARNARHVGTGKWESVKGTESWDRATTEGRNADFEEEDGLGRYWLKLPSGDIHQLLLVKDGEEYAGACSCEGFQYNTEKPCSHLATLRLKEWEDVVDLPSSHEYVRELIAVGEDGSEDAQDGEGDSPGQPSPSDVPASQDGSRVPAEPAETDDAFANPLPDVEDKFVIDMDGSKYIRKAGYARLLSQQGWTVETEEVVGAHETEWERAKYRARIFGEGGRQLATSVGTAGPPDGEDMADADMHLDELAETRAWTRAASIATGEGMTALAEIPDHADKEVNTNV